MMHTDLISEAIGYGGGTGNGLGNGKGGGYGDGDDYGYGYGDGNGKGYGDTDGTGRGAPLMGYVTESFYCTRLISGDNLAFIHCQQVMLS